MDSVSLPASVSTQGFPTDFSRAPFIVIWEVTRACALACVHCRADAIARRDPRELSTTEAFHLIDQIADFGNPHPLLVLTGGDPMWRKDLAEVVHYASAAGLSVALTPSGTGAATRKRLQELKAAGLRRVAVSLDGPDPETHDRFRRVRGSFMYTMKIIEAVIDLGLPLQINTTVSGLTLPTLRAMADRVSEFPLTLWAIFFLIQTGRGAALDQISPRECEDVLRWLQELSTRVPFGIKTTEAPHFRRVLWQAEHATGSRVPGFDGSKVQSSIFERSGSDAFICKPSNSQPSNVALSPVEPAHAELSNRAPSNVELSTVELSQTEPLNREPSNCRTFEPRTFRRPQLRAPWAVNDGNGFVFIDHIGQICPSGFLPMPRGNVRNTSLVDVYRSDEVFVRLRDPDALTGRCGRCRFRAVCGGSRSRAFAATGDVLASDPLCVYEPSADKRLTDLRDAGAARRGVAERTPRPALS